LDYVEPTKLSKEANFTDDSKKKNDPFGTGGVRIDEKTVNPARKGSANVIVPEEEEYDPRKHRIYRGVRKTSMEWTGQGTKIGVPMGSRAKK